eukprot:5135858-Pyramimonas_sp.AAC.2
MVSSAPAILMSSPWLAVSRLLLVSTPRCRTWVFNVKPRGASLVPVPGMRHCKQCFDSSQCSNPGRVRSAVANPGGK